MRSSDDRNESPCASCSTNLSALTNLVGIQSKVDCLTFCVSMDALSKTLSDVRDPEQVSRAKHRVLVCQKVGWIGRQEEVT